MGSKAIAISPPEDRKVCFLCYNDNMEYEFSVGWLVGGLVITIAGTLIVVFYKQISDGLVNGVSSYDKVKLFGVITIIVGLLVTANLHTFILGLIVDLLFKR